MGHTIVLQNTDTSAQRFLHSTPEAEAVCALAAPPSGKHLAVAERCERGTVTVYDLASLKRRKVLASSDALAKVSCLLVA